jgi:hypothetical protein
LDLRGINLHKVWWDDKPKGLAKPNMESTNITDLFPNLQSLSMRSGVIYDPEPNPSLALSWIPHSLTELTLEGWIFSPDL